MEILSTRPKSFLTNMQDMTMSVGKGLSSEQAEKEAAEGLYISK